MILHIRVRNALNLMRVPSLLAMGPLTHLLPCNQLLTACFGSAYVLA